MHRVFGATPPAELTATDAYAELRSFLLSLGLDEHEAGGVYAYHCRTDDGDRRHFATVTGSLRSATIYLYPDALAREAGVAARLYRTLEAAGCGMGSKLGPSIGLNLDDAEQLRQFRSEMTLLVCGPS